LRIADCGLRIGGVLLAPLLCTAVYGAELSGIIVPAYFYPEGNQYWDKLAAAAREVPLIAILNPDSGPGKAADANFVAAIKKVRDAGGRVIGYVSTDYNRGKRTLEVVKADIDKYYAWYAVDGIFLDEMTCDDIEANLIFYGALYSYVKEKAPAALVVGNPGCDTLEAYLARPAADLLVMFESNARFKKAKTGAWARNYAASHFACMPYGIRRSDKMQECLALAAARNLGYVYVTDANEPNPWNRLPAYWLAEVAAVKAALLKPAPAGGETKSEEW
jgi:hypothetical protein